MVCQIFLDERCLDKGRKQTTRQLQSVMYYKQMQKWIIVIPNTNLRVCKDTVVCALNWPSGFEEIKVNGKSRLALDMARCVIPSSTNIITTTTTHNKKPVELHVALTKINYQSFSVTIK